MIPAISWIKASQILVKIYRLDIISNWNSIRMCVSIIFPFYSYSPQLKCVCLAGNQFGKLPTFTMHINIIQLKTNLHYLCISENTEGINLCVRGKTKTLSIFTSNYTSHKCSMPKVIIQSIFIGPVCAFLKVFKEAASVPHSWVEIENTTPSHSCCPFCFTKSKGKGRHEGDGWRLKEG